VQNLYQGILPVLELLHVRFQYLEALVSRCVIKGRPQAPLLLFCRRCYHF